VIHIFAILGAIVAAVGLFGGHIFALNLVYLCFLFIALHLLWDPFASRYPWRRT
jgi:hypothetical protein